MPQEQNKDILYYWGIDVWVLVFQDKDGWQFNNCLL